ncbi:uncharacterized protein LOC127625407 [Xyrauchen texanus]|uniref:uncharacterized protein LOC127625407 n=1 Tax=Xyrauchen texanus TaxID=154827 RepID=UPI002241E106|nr:uncharacterized protein LOC127625407 [Xyrauchen texanus]
MMLPFEDDTSPTPAPEISQRIHASCTGDPREFTADSGGRAMDEPERDTSPSIAPDHQPYGDVCQVCEPATPCVSGGELVVVEGIKGTFEEMDFLCTFKMSSKIESLKCIINLETNANYLKENNYHKNDINSIFNKYINSNKNQKGQFAFMILINKDGSYDKDNWDTIPNSTEKCPKMYKPEQKGEIHSEDKIFDLLNDILCKRDCPFKMALIYSFYTLCFKRHNKESCHKQAVDIAKKLYEKHKMTIFIGCSEPWGINGPYVKNLPYKPLKDCTYTIESQTFRSNEIVSKQERKEFVEKKLIDPIYKKVIHEIQNKPFSMVKITDKPKYFLKPFLKNINNPKTIETCHNIVSNLFSCQIISKNVDDFINHGLEKFEKCKEKIYKLLSYDANNSIDECDLYNRNQEISKYLSNVFFPWWATKVESASSTFLIKETSCLLQRSAANHIHRSTKDIEHYFVIRYVKQQNN